MGLCDRIANNLVCVCVYVCMCVCMYVCADLSCVVKVVYKISASGVLHIIAILAYSRNRPRGGFVIGLHTTWYVYVYVCMRACMYVCMYYVLFIYVP